MKGLNGRDNGIFFSVDAVAVTSDIKQDSDECSQVSST